MANENFQNLDARESAFFLRELNHIKAASYDIKYKDLKATQLIPVNTSVPSGAASITYRRYSKLGIAKIIASYADDLPRADVYGEEVTGKIRSIGNSYGYNVQEIRESQMTGKSLEQRKANAARRANEEKQESVAWFGDSDNNLEGLLNNTNISEYTIPNGAAGTTNWAAKTPDEIIADMNGIVTSVINTTNGKEIPDTMLLSINSYELVRTTRMTGDSNRTILQFFLENNQHITKVEWLTQLSGLAESGDGTDRMIVYPMDPMNLTLEIPQPFEQFRPQERNLEFVVPCHSRTGGVLIYYPLSVAFADGI